LSSSSVALVAAGILGVYSPINPAIAQPGQSSEPSGVGEAQPELPDLGETGRPITTSSGEAELALAAHLKEIGATMYGAWWCPHCYRQKQVFGQQAFAEIDYVECDPDGRNPQTDRCRSEGVRVYPTWKINGQVLMGNQPLTVLADVSGYQGPRNFRNLVP
jgi:glutaredoxin